MNDPSSTPASWTQKVSDAAEHAGLAQIGALGPRLEVAHSRLNDGGYMRAEPRSTLRLDDRYLGIWTEGPLHQVAINAAVDGLLTVRSTIVDAMVVPMTALYPVLRSSIENAALSLSMIYPVDRDERLLASYRAMADDAKRRLQFLIRSAEPNAQLQYDNAMTDIDSLLALRPGLADTPAKNLALPSYTALVEAADERLMSDPAHDKSHHWTLTALWQLLSGLSHGRAWAMLMALERSDAIVDPTPRPGVHVAETRSGTVTQTTSVAFLAIIFTQAIELIESVVRLYGQRSRADTALPADADEPW